MILVCSTKYSENGNFETRSILRSMQFLAELSTSFGVPSIAERDEYELICITRCCAGFEGIVGDVCSDFAARQSPHY